jgi:hypothetical protein
LRYAFFAPLTNLICHGGCLGRKQWKELMFTLLTRAIRIWERNDITGIFRECKNIQTAAAVAAGEGLLTSQTKE